MKTLLIILFFIPLSCFAPGLKVLTIISPEPILRTYSDTEKLQAIIWTETSGGKSRYNPGETESVGLLQIRPIMIKEVNQILGYNKYQLSDRLSDKKSIDIFLIYQHKFNPTMDFEKMCRLWNGGRSGMNKDSTLNYYKNALYQLYQI
jgi:hypothetical protein